MSKPVILTGDLNCAHQEIDIFNPAVSDQDFDMIFLVYSLLVSHPSMSHAINCLAVCILQVFLLSNQRFRIEFKTLFG